MKTLKWLLAAALVVACATAGRALINPNFTPLHLVKQSDLILELEAPEKFDNLKGTLAVKAVLKGKTDAKAIVIDSGGLTEELAGVEEPLFTKAKGTPILMFAGKYKIVEANGQAKEAEEKALFNVQGQWIPATKMDDGGWEIKSIDGHMKYTWDGGSDMLLRGVKYALGDEDPQFPSAVESTWEKPVEAGKFEGDVAGACPVEVGGKTLLYVAAAQGDRLYACDAKSKKLGDATASSKLTAHSQAFCWTDLDGDGDADLASWDGKALTLLRQGPDGTFAAAPAKLEGAALADVIGLCAVPSAKAGKPALAAATAGSTVLLLPKDGDAYEAKPLPAGGDQPNLGKAGVCLSADLDGDAMADLLQTFEKGSLLYKGQGGGAFAAPVACAVALGEGGRHAFTGDFDMDGLLEVCTPNRAGSELWQNHGEGKFSPEIANCGEMRYVDAQGRVFGLTADFNNDGRQDAVLFYAQHVPHFFFNRGFRAFGHAHLLDIAQWRTEPEDQQGQRAGALLDIDGDGRLDVAVVRNGGTLVSLCQKPKADAGLGVALRVKAGAAAGPVNVVAWREKRCLGAWRVAPGEAGAFVGAAEAGPMTLKWRLPGGKPASEEVIVEDGVVRFEIK